MFETLKNAWKVQDTRKKILYTLLIVIIFRIGCSFITVPFLDTEIIKDWISNNSDSVMGYLNVMSGNSMSQATVFALGIQPYINASIIIQLLTYALPPLERLSKEGEEGRKTLNKISAILAFALGIFMSVAFYLIAKNQGAVTHTEGWKGIFAAVIIIACFVTGSLVVIWLGNRVNEKGIGNGISIILFAGILARGPKDIWNIVSLIWQTPSKFALLSPAVLLMFIFMIGFIVFMNNSERRIPIQYAKRVVGRKQYGGQNTHIPIKVCMSGVMPIIFASAFMSLPATIEMFIPVKTGDDLAGIDKFYAGFIALFKTNSWFYAILYFILIIGFNYFYVSMQYNPVEIANNLRQSNGGIPGIRPGKPTSDFIQRILSKITLVGAIFLGLIAVFPIFFSMAVPEMQGLSMQGTSILIVVSVALETVRTLESQMMMRHHKGFLE